MVKQIRINGAGGGHTSGGEDATWSAQWSSPGMSPRTNLAGAACGDGWPEAFSSSGPPRPFPHL
jgi:hypothetical protein